MNVSCELIARSRAIAPNRRLDRARRDGSLSGGGFLGLVLDDGLVAVAAGLDVRERDHAVGVYVAVDVRERRSGAGRQGDDKTTARKAHRLAAPGIAVAGSGIALSAGAGPDIVRM